MRVSLPSEKRRAFKPVMLLDRPPVAELEKGQHHTCKLRTQPSDADSPLCKLTVPIFSTGTPEEWLKFSANLDAVIKGHDITDGPGRYALAQNLLKGDALAAFKSSATATGDETIANFKIVIAEATAHIFPARASRAQKRCMRRFLRKPKEMTTRSWISRVSELNDCLVNFPPLQAGVAAAKLADDEVLEILEFGIPNSWQKQMILQGFDPVSKSLAEFVSFCDRLESSFDEESKPANNLPSSSNKKKTTKSKRKSSEDDGSPSKDCLLHGSGCGHSAHECRTLTQAKRMKSAYDSQHPSKKGNARRSKNFMR